jgi:hypothetical protein
MDSMVGRGKCHLAYSNYSTETLQALRGVEPFSPLWIRTLHRIAAICDRSRTTLPNIKEVDIHELAWFGYNHDFTDFLMRTPIASDGPVDLYKCRREGQYVAVKDFRQRKER